MCESNGSVVSVFADGRKHISTEVVREGMRTVFTITFEAVESKPKELDIPEFMRNRGV
jgi:hypothetical protein|nr:MAG TPA: hypothetical protein [Caudoviricetes sp.]